MSVDARRHTIRLLITFAMMSVAACGHLELSEGRPTTMGVSNASIREALVVSSEAFRGPLRYESVERCDFVLTQMPPRSEPVSVGISVTIRPVGDHLFLGAAGSHGDSSALLGFDGQLLDFNTVDVFTGRRVTSETFQRESQTGLSRFGRSTGTHYINLLQLFVPHYRRASLRDGDVAAVVLDEAGSIWGRYIYRGTAQYAARRVLVLDLMRASPPAAQVLTGFTLVDPQNMLPVLTTLESGMLVHLRRVGCGGSTSP